MKPASSSPAASTTLDELDKKILSLLQKQGNIQNNLLADEVGLTPGPCLRRVQRLKEDGIILRHTIVQNNKALGYGVNSLVEITLKVHSQVAAHRFVKSQTARREVLGCHMVTGDFDFVLKVCAKDFDDYRQFLWELHSNQDVDRVRSTFLLETFKDDVNVLP